jgi:Flp pilus assembly protein TadD
VDAAVAVLRRASGAYPTEARLHYTLAFLLKKVRPPQPEEVTRALAVARALRPELAAHDLAHTLEDHGEAQEAGAVWADLVRRRPQGAGYLACYASHLERFGRAAEARPVLDRAVAAARERLRRRPNDSNGYSNLGIALARQGNLEEALVVLCKSLSLLTEHDNRLDNHTLVSRGRANPARPSMRLCAILQNPCAASRTLRRSPPRPRRMLVDLTFAARPLAGASQLTGSRALGLHMPLDPSLIRNFSIIAHIDHG